MAVEEVLAGATVSNPIAVAFPSVSGLRTVAFFGNGSNMGDNTNLVPSGPALVVSGSPAATNNTIAVGGVSGTPYVDLGYMRNNTTGVTFVAALSTASSGFPSQVLKDPQLNWLATNNNGSGGVPPNVPSMYTQIAGVQTFLQLPTTTIIRIIAWTWAGTGQPAIMYDLTGGAGSSAQSAAWSPIAAVSNLQVAPPTGATQALNLAAIWALDGGMSSSDLLSKVYTPMKSWLKFRGIATA